MKTAQQSSNNPAVVLQLLTPIQQYLDDETLFEVVVNQPGELWIEGLKGWERIKNPELTYAAWSAFARAVAAFADQKIDTATPVLSATLPKGERIQIVMPPAVPAGTVSITIRKPSQVTFNLDELQEKGLFDIAVPAVDLSDIDATLIKRLSDTDKELLELYRAQEWRNFLEKSVIYHKNMIISGATGSGKTTLSKALVKVIPDDERIITIEDTPELVIPQPNRVHLYYSKGGQGTSKAGAKELLESCLRMRPDRILLQELRDGTAFYYIRNVNSGHPGSITTVHANSSTLAFEQLTLLVKESEGGQDLERADIRHLLKLLVDVVVQCKRVDKRFRVTEVYFDPFSQFGMQ